MSTNPETVADVLVSCVSYSITYPLFAFNARVALEKQWELERSTSLNVCFAALRRSYQTEGLTNGVFKGLPAHIFHRILLGISRLCANSVLQRLDPRIESPITKAERKKREEDRRAQERRHRYIAKYACEILCYPALTLATRCLLVKPTMSDILQWNKVDGLSLWFQGLAPFLLQLCLEDIGSHFVEGRLEHLETGDKEVMSLSSVILVTLLTTPINNISIVRRCHSHLPNLVKPQSIREQFACNPWGAIFFQFVIFASMMGMNYYLIHLGDDKSDRNDRNRR